jgi:cellulose biosynthesis protein BcsQ
MRVVSIFSNKGGEGKSTVTVGLAEFLASNRDKSVLLIDLDAQASSASAILGHQTVLKAIRERRTSVDLMNQIRSKKQVPENLADFLMVREATDARGSSLAELHVLVPDGGRQFELEEQMSSKRDSTLFLKLLKPAIAEYDYVLVDHPGNINKGSLVPVNGLVMSDLIVTPLRPTRMSVSGLPRTLDLIEYAQSVAGNGGPALLGFLLNGTDRRHQQYRANLLKYVENACEKSLPPIFENVWPPAAALEAATDPRRDFRTLKERFGDAYDHARKVAIELDKKCQAYQPPKSRPSMKQSLLELLGLG